MMRPIHVPFVLSLLLMAHAALAADPARQHLSFDANWRFHLDDISNAAQPEYDDASWRSLQLPHDWSIEGPFSQTAPAAGGGAYLPTGLAWYRRHFVLPLASAGRRVLVQFDGVYMNSDVYLNGHLLGNQPYGYTSFVYDLTPYLKPSPADNVLAVRVDNTKQPNSRWYSGSGIYRHVWLTLVDPLHVAPWGVYVTTPKITPQAATVAFRTRLQNDDRRERTASFIVDLLDADGKTLATATGDARIAPGAEQEVAGALELPRPTLWSAETPFLYRLRTRLHAGDQVLDEVETPFGVRDIRFDVDRGFLLNGQPVKFLGMCIHHDGGAFGAAVPRAVWQRRLDLLKAMGCNALRMSHNPPDPELLDLCDRMGFFVMDEAFDEWQSGKTPAGYARYFDQWALKDLRAMLRRDRNHPSIVLWSVGNEINEQTRDNGLAVLRPLVDLCHAEDPTRPVTAACDRVYSEPNPAKLDFLAALDIVGYNYVDRWRDNRELFFDLDRHRFPQRRFIGSEDVSVAGARGSYEFAPLGDGPERARYATAMIRAEQLWKFVRTHDYVIGDFAWTGVDYLGEARWPAKAASSGVLDTCGFPKDGYYFYQSQWTSQPMLHLFPHWNWPGREGRIVPVLAYTNCESVELFLNGRSLGVKALEFPRQGAADGWNRYARPQVFPTTADLHLAWDVPYEPGLLKAVGRRGGRIVCEQQIATAGPPAALLLTSDRPALPADPRDVAHLTVKVVDAQGVLVPRADTLITFEIEGPATLVAVDNGNPASHEPYRNSRRSAFNGLAMAFVRADQPAGKITVTARAEGLKQAVVELDASPAPPP